MSPFYLGCFVITFLFAFIFIMASRIHYQGKYKNSYSIKGMFPYEFNYRSSFFDNFYGNISAILSFFGLITFHILFLNQQHNDPLYIWIFVSGTISSITFLGLLFTPLYTLKVHVFMDALSFASNLLKPSLIFIASLQTNAINPTIQNNIVMTISLLCSLCVLILILNPKLSLTFKYETKNNEKGETIKSRPKWIVLAFSEWMCIFVNYISFGALFLYTFVK